MKIALNPLAERSVLESIRRSVSTAVEGVNGLAACFEGDTILSSSLVNAVELIGGRKGRVVVAGVGKSGHIARKIAATMASTGTSAYFVHPTEASHGDLGMITSDDLLVLLSWSGETVELVNMLAYAKRFDVPVVSVCSNADSLLARNSTVSIVLPKVQEACPHGLAPTVSTMLQMAVGDALAVALLERRCFSAQDFKVFHPGGRLGSQLVLVKELSHERSAIPLLPLGSAMGDALIQMSSKGFGVVGITDDAGKLRGVITDGDLRRKMSRDLLLETVNTVMTHNPRTICASLLASEAMKLMQMQKVTVLFLVDDVGIPTGILHIQDLLRAGVA